MIVLEFGFVLVVAVTLAALVARRIPWPVKLLLVVVVPWFAFAIHSAADSLRGWPTSDGPPKTATFVWGVVREPDPQTGDRGEIDLWLQNRSGSGTDSEPRAYRLPYTRQLHKQVDQATRLTRRGAQVAIARRTGRKQPDGHGRARINGLRIYRLPPAQPPRKR